jgi:hypothetical protein
VQDDARAGDWDQGARMKYLGAVMRDLGGLTMVEPRQEACIGHQSRIGGQDAGDILPQHDVPSAQRAAEQRGGQI